MMRATMTRFETSDQGTFGRIDVPGLALFTGELPWRDNAANDSCIPPGEYRCVWTFSPRFRRMMYLVEGVLGRGGIRKHSANFMGDAALGYRKQLNGCIALGERLGVMDRQKALLLSAPAMRRFEKYMGGMPFLLEVKECLN